jgi:malonyl-CoA/methylmalonyl-CoA synthetase
MAISRTNLYRFFNTTHYADLDRESARIASFLVKSKIRLGDRVAVKVEKCPEFISLYCACLRIGAIFLPLNPSYTTHEIEYFLGDAEPALFISSNAELDRLVDDAKSEGDRFSTIDLDLDSPAAILYTSGTTGRSKGAILTHGNLLSNAQTLVSEWGFSEDDVLIHSLPLFHTHGLFVAVHCCLLSGAKMIFNEKFDPKETISQFEDATVFMGVPTFYTRLLAQKELSRDGTKRMRLFVSGSAPLLASTHAEFEERTGHKILERYGMTETTMLTSNPLFGERKPGTVGKPLPGLELRIRKNGTDPIGSIEVKGPGVFNGYWRMPEKTEESFTQDGYFVTGDLGSADDEGYVTISGRGKDLIITGGLNVYPKEVESVLDGLTGILESAVVGIPHPDFGEAVVAFVTVDKKIEAAKPSELLTEARKKLAGYKVPKAIFTLEMLPRNTMGKIQKAELRTIARERFGNEV